MSNTRPSVSAEPAVPPPGTNLVVLRGTLSRDAEPRSLPSGDQVVAYEVTVRPPSEGAAAPRADSVPVSWFDAPASAVRLRAGAEVVVVGRVRRRFFRSGGSTASRTEVVATRVLPVRSHARVLAAVASALDGLDPG